MLIKYATTDGDSRSAEGIDHAMKSFHPIWNVQRLADPTHLGQSQFRKCNQADFSQEMFPGKTREQRKEQQKVLSQDIKARCSLILKELMMDFAGDMNSLRRILRFWNQRWLVMIGTVLDVPAIPWSVKVVSLTTGGLVLCV